MSKIAILSKHSIYRLELISHAIEFGVEAKDYGSVASLLSSGEKFDVIVVDQFKGTTEALTWVKELRQGADLDIPILVLLPGEEGHMVNRYIQAGASDFLMKPFEKSLLRIRLQQLNILKGRSEEREEFPKPMDLVSDLPPELIANEEKQAS